LSRDCDLVGASGKSTAAKQVNYTYCLLLGRHADPEETEDASLALAGGSSTSDLLRRLASSAEFAARYRTGTLSNPDYVSLAYRLLLGRDPDEGGKEAYLAALASGASTREDIASAIAGSGEFVERHPVLAAPSSQMGASLVQPRDCDLEAAASIPEPTRRAAYAYCLMLGRDPVPAEIKEASRALEDGTSPASLLASLFSSAEFADRYRTAGLGDAEVVALVYGLLFDRDPDPGGAAGYVEALGTGGLTGSALVEAAARSNEFVEKHPALAAPA
jgi:hypothetical protein